MTNKKRLEEIKERVLVDMVYYKYLDGTEGHWGKAYTLSEEDYNYLIERVQELETTVDFYQSALRDADRRVQELESRIADDEHFVAEILEQNKRYRKALEEIRNHGTFELNNALKTGYAWIAHEALEKDNEPLRAEVSE